MVENEVLGWEVELGQDGQVWGQLGNTPQKALTHHRYKSWLVGLCRQAGTLQCGRSPRAVKLVPSSAGGPLVSQCPHPVPQCPHKVPQ